MPLFPFTPVGVSDKVDELYALSDGALNVEAAAIRTDFRLWVSDNFSLDTSQTAYLNSMSNDAVKYYGEQCGLCFTHRLPITLVYPVPVPGYIKWVTSENDIVVDTDATGQIEVSGSFSFIVNYR